MKVDKEISKEQPVAESKTKEVIDTPDTNHLKELEELRAFKAKIEDEKRIQVEAEKLVAKQQK